MAIGTYDELKTAVANWLDRDDLTDRIPEFISLAEARFNRVLRLRSMETKQTGKPIRCIVFKSQNSLSWPSNIGNMKLNRT